MHERLRDQNAPLHAAREAGDLVVDFFRESEALNEFLNPGVVVSQAVVAALLPQNLADGKEGIKGDFLRDDPDRHFGAPRIGDDIHADQGGLAGAVRAQQAEEFALLHLKGDALKGVRVVPFAVIGFCEVLNAQGIR